MLDIGGLIDRDTEKTKTAWSWFVKQSVEEDAEVTLNARNKEQSCNRRCLLIPISVLSSAMLMKFADKTGQPDVYSLVDSETPSCVSEIASESSCGDKSSHTAHNSTAINNG